MDNISIARLLDETASLLEIDSADPFRIRSYRRAAEAVEQQTTQLSTLADDPKQLLAIPGIGKGMAANIQALLSTGTLPLREELLQKVWSLHGDTLSRTVDVHIAGLRKKIEADPRYPKLLLTVKGIGYKLAI